MLVLLQGTHLQKGLGQLLYVEGIALRLLEDESLDVGSHRPRAQEFLHQCYTFSLRKALQDQTGVVGPISPICARIPWVPLDNMPLGCNGHALLFARLAAIEDIKRLGRQPL